MGPSSLDDLIDQLVATYSDRLSAGGERDTRDLLEQLPEEHRPALARCLRVVEAGLGRAPLASAPLGAGVELGGFRIEREIGRGGMSIVYLAEQPALKRKVALKVLRAGLATDQRHVDRFRREALAIARLQHPHIVQVHAVGEERGWHYLAMEHIDGRNLSEVYDALASIEPRRRTREDLARACGSERVAELGANYEAALAGLLAPVARAIGVAHEIGIVHRDVKPSNILIHKDGRALIADFGLAKGDDDPGLSLTGEPLGTPYYMSPEQAEASFSAVDQRTDVYSLGVTFYEGLAGRRPFEGETALVVLNKVRSEVPRPVMQFNKQVSGRADAVVTRAMARERDERYARVLDLASDLAAVAEGRPTQALLLEKGAAQQIFLGIRIGLRGKAFEYRSRAGLLGWPLVHVNLGAHARPRQLRTAKGWLAIGDTALGFVAIGSRAAGVFAFGGAALGVVSFAGVSAGALAFGGIALGVSASGGVAVAWHEALGGLAVARDFAAGGYAIARHVIDGATSDPIAVEHFQHGWRPLAHLLLRTRLGA